MTLLIAHRGASAAAPENTLGAFDAAVAAGVHGIELDVHRTADGVLVVHHDPVPVAEATDAALVGRPIAGMTHAELATFRVAGTHAIPTLREVFTRVGGRATVYCELKGPGTAAPTVALIRELGVPAAVHSFDHRQVLAAQRLSPGVPRGILETAYHLDNTLSLLAVEGRDLWQHWSLIDQALVREVHGVGGRVIAWTVNAPPLAVALARMGVDAICTDDPARVRAAE